MLARISAIFTEFLTEFSKGSYMLPSTGGGFDGQVAALPSLRSTAPPLAIQSQADQKTKTKTTIAMLIKKQEFLVVMAPFINVCHREKFKFGFSS